MFDIFRKKYSYTSKELDILLDYAYSIIEKLKNDHEKEITILENRIKELEAQKQKTIIRYNKRK